MSVEEVYLLYHIRDTGELLLIGAYRSEEDAQAAVERVKDKPGFVDYPNNFEYHAYRLGADNWSDGFIVDEDEQESETKSVN